MTVPTTIDAGAWLGKYLEESGADTDLVRSMLGAFAEAGVALHRGLGAHDGNCHLL